MTSGFQECANEKALHMEGFSHFGFMRSSSSMVGRTIRMFEQCSVAGWWFILARFSCVTW